ncbi:MAG: glycosyltransferase family 4 protein [Spirochaetaceae bacterium]|nr:glycosyltransferase family 4 protein [Spirochaetaceae bacterium]
MQRNISSLIYKIDGVGINLNRFKPLSSEEEKDKIRSRLGYSSSDFIILNVAEINKNKNQIFLLKCVPRLLKEIPSLKILFAGKKNISEPERFVRKNKLGEYVDFLGYRSDVEKLFNISDIVFSASRREGQGLNLVEGMACGLPIVASDIRGHRDVIKQFENGILFPLNNKELLISSILLLYKNPDFRKELGKRNIVVARQYGIEKIAEKMREIYNSLLLSGIE